MPEIYLVQPVGEPLHLAEAKNDRRVDDSADDSKIKSLIVAARQAAESKTRRQLLHARLQLVLDRFPGGSGAALENQVNIPSYAIQLPKAPVVDIISIQYVDMAGVLQTMPPSDYVANLAMEPAIITPCFGKIWPIPLPQIGSVTVTYDAGYASPITVTHVVDATHLKVAGPVSWVAGARVRFYNSGGALPAPIDGDSTYLVATAANGAYSLTDLAGGAISFTDDGSGRNFIGVVPEGIRSWMLLRIGSLYENREEVAILNRGKVELLPYVDGLLDPYMPSVY